MTLSYYKLVKYLGVILLGPLCKIKMEQSFRLFNFTFITLNWKWIIELINSQLIDVAFSLSSGRERFGLSPDVKHWLTEMSAGSAATYTYR